MVYLITDADEAKALPCPAAVRIGRGVDNNIRPESQSVSKHHAVLHVNFVTGTTKVEVKVEDLQSRNGTFIGPSPLEMEKVSGTKFVIPGSYIRFGHSQKYFRLVDRVEGYEEEIMRVSATSPNMKLSMSNGNRDLGKAGAVIAPIFPHADLKIGGNTFQDRYQTSSRNRSESPVYHASQSGNEIFPNSSIQHSAQEVISTRAEYSKSGITFQPYSKSTHDNLEKYAKYLQLFHNSLSSLFQQATQSNTNEFNQATTTSNGRTLNEFFEKEYDIDQLESQLILIRKSINLNKDAILITFLSVNTLETDINTMTQILDMVLSIISIFSGRFASHRIQPTDDFDHSNHEINTAILKEALDVLCSMSSVFFQFRKNPFVDQVENILTSHFKSQKFSTNQLTESLEGLRESLMRCTNIGLVSDHKFFEVSKVIVSSLCPFSVIASIEYISLLYMLEMCSTEIDYSSNKKAVGSNATLLKIRRIASMRDSSQVKASIDDFRKEEMEVMAHRHGRLSRVFHVIVVALLRFHFTKWKTSVIQRRAKLMTLWGTLSQYAYRIKRDAFKNWLSKSGFLLSVKRSLDRLFRQLSHGAFKKISKFFYKWVRAIDSGKKKSLLRGVEEQLDYMLLKSQIELLRNGENLSAKLIAEKALNRELLATNVHIRELLHQSIVTESQSFPPNVLLENSALKSQLDMLREEMDKIKEYLNSRRPPKSSSRTNSVKLNFNNSSGDNTSKKLMALKLLEFELKSLRSKLEISSSANETLTNELTKEKVKNAELALANQELASRLSKMESSGNSLRNILLARYGEQEVLQILSDLDRKLGLDQWLLTSFADKS